MLGLKLSLEKLPASAHPERANVYVCDKCGRQITKHLGTVIAHSRPPIGAERYRCKCGSRDLIGAIEWDHMGSVRRGQYFWGTFVVGLLLSFSISVFVFLVFLVLHVTTRSDRPAIYVAITITALPFISVHCSFWPRIVASMWRTRFGSSVLSD